jgi:transcriptional regulator with PAS, ATPase and Fis domain
MPLFSTSQQRQAKVISQITYANPFDPARIEFERQALGRKFKGDHAIWSMDTDANDLHNIDALKQMTTQLVIDAHQKMTQGLKPDATELALYEDMVFYLLYENTRNDLERILANPQYLKDGNQMRQIYQAFEKQFYLYLKLPEIHMPSAHQPEHVFAVYFQIRRAFENIYTCMVGRSKPMAKLRESVWQSLFTHDERRYVRGLYSRMADFTTLITGPSGTGKELVARAIGQSRYIPFNPKNMQFSEHHTESFYPLNLSALSPTLIESELFGHKRGTFTGATSDRKGWLEVCPLLGAVFLDEIGELDLTIQVKLLRVLQSRTFQRLGESKDRHFAGKIIAATNRDLPLEMQAKTFREDLYYRLCSDIITTPSLSEQLADQPDDLTRLVKFILRRLLGDDAPAATQQVLDHINEQLGNDYPWPGNIRELQQCVSNILIRGNYQPRTLEATTDPIHALKEVTEQGTISADTLLNRYCKWIYGKLGSYEAAAAQLGLDRRTVKKRVDEAS